jgi:hypothetical protein
VGDYGYLHVAPCIVQIFSTDWLFRGNLLNFESKTLTSAPRHTISEKSRNIYPIHSELSL